MATRRSKQRHGNAAKTSSYRTVEKFLLDIQHNARILGHAALTKNWEIAISISVHIDNLPRRIEGAYKLARTMPEPAAREMDRRLRQMYRGWQTTNEAVRGAPSYGAKDLHAHRDAKRLRIGALQMFDGALAAYSLLHHWHYGTLEGYLATRHAFKRGLRERRLQVTRNLRAWPGQA
jgi:hypothetical protein